MPKHPRLRATSLVALASITSLATALVPSSPAAATSLLKPITGVASVSTSGATGNLASVSPSVSTGGRYVAFASFATDLVPLDTNKAEDVFVRDTLTGRTSRVSVGASGAAGNANSDQPSISADGHHLAFRSLADNLVFGDTNGQADVFVKDLVGGGIVRADVDPMDGAQAVGGPSGKPVISDDGQTVAFESSATNLDGLTSNGVPDVFVRWLGSPTSQRVSVTTTEVGLVSGGTNPSMSGDGTYVTFDSTTDQISPGSGNGVSDVFVRNRATATTQVASLSSGGVVGDGASTFGSISDDGRYVTFQSAADDLVTVAASGKDHIFRRDLTAHVTQLVDVDTGGGDGDQGASAPQISADGTRIAFSSPSTDLVAGDTNGRPDIFVRDVGSGTTTRASVRSANGLALDGFSQSAAISPDGSATAFQTLATNVGAKDLNGYFDVYVRSSYQAGPWVDSTALLGSVLADFSGAKPTTGQVVAANDLVLTGLRSTPRTIVDLAHGPFDDHRGPVIRLYWAFFERLPDEGGLAHWVKKHANGTSVRAIANGFATSPEFVHTYGSLGNEAFVSLVYQNVLDRDPDEAGLSHWVGRLAKGVSRGEVMSAFSESSEGIRHMRGETDAVLLYEGLIRRLPTKAEFTAGVSILEDGQGQPSEVLADLLLTSTTYALRFG